VSIRRILITGATGGLGHALVCEAIARGHNVLATGRSREIGEQLKALGASFAALDLGEPHADIRGLAASCDSVIHAAALSASWGPAEAFETANITVTRRLIDAAGAEGVGRFVFVSSPSIFARFADHIEIRENEPPAAEPLNHYARTKFAAEQAVLSHHSHAIACCAVRPRALVGPGDRVILPRLVALALRKRMPLPRGGAALIELTDLRDAAWAICEAEERAPEIARKAVNISGGNPVSVRQVAMQLAAALGENPRLLSLPIAIAKPVARLLEAVARFRGAKEEPLLTRYTLATLGWSQTFDQEPAYRLLGYTPRYNALETLLSEARKLKHTGSAT
jgi:2-alkyl-3-oxoalkanoate reductase